MAISIFQLANNVRGINVRTLMEDSILSNEEDIKERNQNQLRKGKNTKGKNIKPEYAIELYAQGKQSMNSAPDFGTPDLKVTGELWDGIGVSVVDRKVTVISSDKKANLESIKQYPDIWGLDTKNQTENRQLNNAKTVRYFKIIAGL